MDERWHVLRVVFCDADPLMVGGVNGHRFLSFSLRLRFFFLLLFACWQEFASFVKDIVIFPMGCF